MSINTFSNSLTLWKTNVVVPRTPLRNHTPRTESPNARLKSPNCLQSPCAWWRPVMSGSIKGYRRGDRDQCHDVLFVGQVLHKSTQSQIRVAARCIREKKIHDRVGFLRIFLPVKRSVLDVVRPRPLSADPEFSSVFQRKDLICGHPNTVLRGAIQRVP